MDELTIAVFLDTAIDYLHTPIPIWGFQLSLIQIFHYSIIVDIACRVVSSIIMDR